MMGSSIETSPSSSSDRMTGDADHSTVWCKLPGHSWTPLQYIQNTIVFGPFHLVPICVDTILHQLKQHHLIEATQHDFVCVVVTMLFVTPLPNVSCFAVYHPATTLVDLALPHRKPNTLPGPRHEARPGGTPTPSHAVGCLIKSRR